MTEKKQPKEQIASHTYRRRVPSSIPRSLTRRRIPGEMAHNDIHGEEQHEQSVAKPRSRQRIVTPARTVQPTAWNSFAERRDQRFSAQSKPSSYTKLTPRTLAKTGVPASSGRIPAVRRALPQQRATPVPARSGRRAARRGFLWKLLGIFAVLVLLILATNFVLTSAAFRIADVNIVGSDNEVIVRSVQQMGIQGQNIFLLDVPTVTERIEAFPMVASAHIDKQWPNQVTVTISQRVPALLWQTKQGTYSVDKDGVVIAPASETGGTDHLLTVVDVRRTVNGATSAGKGGLRIQPGTRLNAGDVAFAVQVATQLPRLTGISNFSLRYDDTQPTGQTNTGSYGTFVVVSQSGWSAYLGGASNTNPLDNRLAELQQILSLAQQQQLNLATIDLRFGLRPVYTLKS